MTRIHGAEVEQFDDRTSVLQLGGVIRGWRKLLENLAADSCRGLLLLDHGTVAKVALDKEDHLVVAHQDLVAADIVEPALHQGLDAGFIFVGTGACRCQGGRNRGNECLGVRRYEVFGKLDELGMQSADIAVLSGTEAG